MSLHLTSMTPPAPGVRWVRAVAVGLLLALHFAQPALALGLVLCGDEACGIVATACCCGETTSPAEPAAQAPQQGCCADTESAAVEAVESPRCECRLDSSPAPRPAEVPPLSSRDASAGPALVEWLSSQAEAFLGQEAATLPGSPTPAALASAVRAKTPPPSVAGASTPVLAAGAGAWAVRLRGAPGLLPLLGVARI